MGEKVIKYYVAYTHAPAHFDEDESDIRTKTVEIKVKPNSPPISNLQAIRESLRKELGNMLGRIISFSKIDEI
ncbi:MAG: hypothetical protein J6I84_04170 [Bacilli bacterium]|nr:hypothetical protein [Bacilli bacterium]